MKILLLFCMCCQHFDSILDASNRCSTTVNKFWWRERASRVLISFVLDTKIGLLTHFRCWRGKDCDSDTSAKDKYSNDCLLVICRGHSLERMLLSPQFYAGEMRTTSTSTRFGQTMHKRFGNDILSWFFAQIRLNFLLVWKMVGEYNALNRMEPKRSTHNQEWLPRLIEKLKIHRETSERILRWAKGNAIYSSFTKLKNIYWIQADRACCRVSKKSIAKKNFISMF